MGNSVAIDRGSSSSSSSGSSNRGSRGGGCSCHPSSSNRI